MAKSTYRSPARRPPVPPARKSPRGAPLPAPDDRPTSDLLHRVRQDPRWIVLPVRAYLGFTFLYAGLSKVADRSFFDSSSPASLHATLLAVRAHSPIGGLLGPVEQHPVAFGLLIAVGETAVGAGTLFGLWARIAALGGMLISLPLFLTVSWNATPWYTGADLVYLFAFTPLLLGGAGPLSLDAWLALRREAERRAGAWDVDRGRRVLVTSLAGLGALIALGAAGLVRRRSSANSSATAASGTPATGGSATATTGPTTGTTTGTTTGAALVAASAVPVGGAAQATDPQTGDPMYVLQLREGVFTGLDAICPHQGCAVSFVSASAGFVCPCHRSTFDSSGAVTRGPAAGDLAKIPVVRSGDQIVRT